MQPRGVVGISIHALREEGDFSSSVQTFKATHFYPRPPRGGRPAQNVVVCCLNRISIHALREEGDAASARFRSAMTVFLSTPSARRATPGRSGCNGDIKISIHALREEGDALMEIWASARPDFYPRPPRGGRLMTRTPAHCGRLFLSTPSARRATCSCVIQGFLIPFLSTPSARRATSW